MTRNKMTTRFAAVLDVLLRNKQLRLFPSATTLQPANKMNSSEGFSCQMCQKWDLNGYKMCNNWYLVLPNAQKLGSGYQMCKNCDLIIPNPNYRYWLQ